MRPLLLQAEKALTRWSCCPRQSWRKLPSACEFYAAASPAGGHPISGICLQWRDDGLRAEPSDRLSPYGPHGCQGAAAVEASRFAGRAGYGHASNCPRPYPPPQACCAPTMCDAASGYAKDAAGCRRRRPAPVTGRDDYLQFAGHPRRPDGKVREEGAGTSARGQSWRLAPELFREGRYAGYPPWRHRSSSRRRRSPSRQPRPRSTSSGICSKSP